MRAVASCAQGELLSIRMTSSGVHSVYGLDQKSPANARRLMKALSRASEQSIGSQTVQELRQEVGIAEAR